MTDMYNMQSDYKADTQPKSKLSWYTDQDGKTKLKEVIGTDNDFDKIAQAGTAIINEYGTQKYSDGALKAGWKSFIKGVADIPADFAEITGAAQNLFDATGNFIQGKGFIAD